MINLNLVFILKSMQGNELMYAVLGDHCFVEDLIKPHSHAKKYIA